MGIMLRAGASAPICLLFTAFAVASDAQENPSCPTLRYEVIDLHLPDGVVAGFLNDRGQLAGRHERDASSSAFLWDCASGITDTGTLAQGDHSDALALNNAGQIVGINESPLLHQKIFIWDREKGIRKVIQGNAVVHSFNERGDLTMTDTKGAELWNEATGAHFAVDTTGAYMHAPRINNRGEMAGRVFGGRVARSAYLLWNPVEGARNLGEGPDMAPNGQFITTDATAFNDRGDLLGHASTREPGVPRISSVTPFIMHRDGSFAFLLQPANSQVARASQLNNRRQSLVVSDVLFESSHFVQYLWDPEHGLRDFEELVLGRPRDPLVPPAIGGDVINNWGWILGALAPRSQSRHQVLIVPVPADDPFYENMSRLQGEQLCNALASLKLRTTVAALACD
jgi:hypothetical protein